MELDEAERWTRSISRDDAAAVARDAMTLLLAEYNRRGTEIARLHRIIREYVTHIEDGRRFDALVDAVPGLESDDGVYPTGELDRLRAALAERDAEITRLRAAAEELRRCWRDRKLTTDYPVSDARVGKDLARALDEHRRALAAAPAPADPLRWTVRHTATGDSAGSFERQADAHEIAEQIEAAGIGVVVIRTGEPAAAPAPARRALGDDEYRAAIDLCESAVEAARSDDGGPMVAGHFLGRLWDLLSAAAPAPAEDEAPRTFCDCRTECSRSDPSCPLIPASDKRAALAPAGPSRAATTNPRRSPVAEVGRPQGANCTPADKDTVDRRGLVHDWRDAERTDGVDDHHDWYLCIRCGCRDSD